MKNPTIILVLSSVLTLSAYAAVDGAAIWDSQCAKCHGADGAGDTKMGKKLKITNLTDAAVQAKFTDDAIVTSIKEGVTNEKGKKKMVPIEGLSEEEMQAMIPHVRGLVK